MEAPSAPLELESVIFPSYLYTLLSSDPCASKISFRRACSLKLVSRALIHNTPLIVCNCTLTLQYIIHYTYYTRNMYILYYLFACINTCNLYVGFKVR